MMDVLCNAAKIPGTRPHKLDTVTTKEKGYEHQSIWSVQRNRNDFLFTCPLFLWGRGLGIDNIDPMKT